MKTQERELTAGGTRDDAGHGLSDEEIQAWACDESVAKNIAAALAVNINKGFLTRWREPTAEIIREAP
jgi:hypothetical protein